MNDVMQYSIYIDQISINTLIDVYTLTIHEF